MPQHDSSFRPPAWTAVPRAIWPYLIGIVIAGLLQFVIQPAIGGFGSNLLFFIAINVILAVSLTVINGFTGQFSIGHAGFMALGGYAAAALVYYGSFRLFGDADFHGGLFSYSGVSDYHGPLFARGDWLFLSSCLVAGVFAAAVGWLVGLPSLRLRGDYLAIVTLGFGEIVRVILQATPAQYFRFDTENKIATEPFFKLLNHLGGSLGFIYVPTYSTLFWVWIAAAITLIATVRLKLSSYGRALLSVREDEVAAKAMGVQVTRYKVRAFMYGAFFAGIAGALYAMQIGSINAGEFGFMRSFDVVIMVVLGGMGSVSGAALAAGILTVLPELLRDPQGLFYRDPYLGVPWGIVLVAVIASLIIIFAPRRRAPLITLAVLCVVWEGVRHLAMLIGINLSEYRMVLYALALIFMMILRPEGLLGVREIWDYFPLGWQRLRRLWQRSAT